MIASIDIMWYNIRVMTIEASNKATLKEEKDMMKITSKEENGGKLTFRLESREKEINDYLVELYKEGEEQYNLVNFDDRIPSAIFLAHALKAILDAEEIQIRIGKEGMLEPRMALSSVVRIMLAETKISELKNLICRG